MSQMDVVNTCVLCIWDASIDSLHNLLRIVRKNIVISFDPKNKNRIYKNAQNFLLQGFRQSRPLISPTLNFKLIEKNANKNYSKPCQVQPILLSFWAGGFPTATREQINSSKRTNYTR